MTIEEAYQAYGARKTVTLVSDSLIFLARRIYNSDTEQYLRILQVLNAYDNWYDMEAGQPIYYLDPSVVQQVGTLY